MDNVTLSNREQELLDFITNSPEKVTIKLIEEKLSPNHVGGLGRLVGKKLVESTKERQGEQKYGAKYVKIYRLVTKTEEK